MPSGERLQSHSQVDVGILGRAHEKAVDGQLHDLLGRYCTGHNNKEEAASNGEAGLKKDEF